MMLAIVEDNPINAAMVESMLRRLGCGYCTVVFGSAEALIAYLDRNGDHLSAALVDESLPGLPGHQLVAELRARFPQAFLVSMTAYGPELMPDVPAGADMLLRKPLAAADFLPVVEHAPHAARPAHPHHQGG